MEVQQSLKSRLMLYVSGANPVFTQRVETGRELFSFLQQIQCTQVGIAQIRDRSHNHENKERICGRFNVVQVAITDFLCGRMNMPSITLMLVFCKMSNRYLAF